jgi:Ca-activated chloride channel family protein
MLLPFTMGGCERKPDDHSHVAASAGAVSPADRQMIAESVAPEAIAAARAYLVPFTRAEQASCFSDVLPTGAQIQARSAPVFAAPAGVTHVVVAIDGSRSMAGRIGGRSKLALAKEATLAFIDGLGADVELSVLAFGSQGDNGERGKPQSCRAIDQLAPMSRNRAVQRQSVQVVRAVGWTPLAAALHRAQALLASTPAGRQVIYVVSDGDETCGGDPVAVARLINTGQTRAIVNIIGFDLPAADRAALQKVASAGGGALIDIPNDASYWRTLAATREAGRLSANLTAASMAKSHTVIDTGGAIARATICTGEMITRETLNVGADLTRRAVNKQPAPDRQLVFAVLGERHKVLTDQREAFEARLKHSRDRSNDTVDAHEKQAR